MVSHPHTETELAGAASTTTHTTTCGGSRGGGASGEHMQHLPAGQVFRATSAGFDSRQNLPQTTGKGD